MHADNERQGQPSAGEDRVEKGWQQRGLRAFSITAILNTLRHYGVQVDEQSFRSLSEQLSWGQIAERWRAVWKGTGKFSHFPGYAAKELWHRLSPYATPEEYSEALHVLAAMLRDVIPVEGLGAALDDLEHLNQKHPREDGRPQQDFVARIQAQNPLGGTDFELAVSALARHGHWEHAERLVALEELLFPERTGLLRTYLAALRGERAESITALASVANRRTESNHRRLSALDLLISLDAWDEALQCTSSMLESAIAEKHYGFAAAVSYRLSDVLEEKAAAEQPSRCEVCGDELIEVKPAEHAHAAENERALTSDV